MHLYSFEKLEVCKEAIQLAVKTYKTTDGFPNDEKFGLTSQMRRCPIAVPSNIVEGTARTISKELNFISNENYLLLRTDIESITNKINILRKHFLNT